MRVRISDIAAETGKHRLEVVRVLHGPVAIAGLPRIASEHVRGDIPAVLLAHGGDDVRYAGRVALSHFALPVRTGTGCCSGSAASAAACSSGSAAASAADPADSRCCKTSV